MGNCFCIPRKPLINTDTPDLGLKPIKPKDQIISTPTSNHSKNTSPKHDFKNGANNNDNATQPKNIENNNNEEDDDMESVTQIFIRNEDENIDSENINDQAKMKIEDFKLLKVCSLLFYSHHNKKFVGNRKRLIWKSYAS